MVRQFARRWRRRWLIVGAALLTCLSASGIAGAQEGKEPAYRIILRARSGEAAPESNKDGQTGGTQIEVVQRTPDTVLVIMRGAVVAGAEQNNPGMAAIHFMLHQDFEVAPTRAGVRPPRLTLSGQLIGVMQSSAPQGGTAEQGPACAAVQSAGQPVLDFCIKPHAVASCQKLLVNDQASALDAVVLPGCDSLHQTFVLGANAPPPDHHVFPRIVPAASAVFAPDAKLDTRWNYTLQAFRAMLRGEFGFSVLLRVTEAPAAPAPVAAPRPE